MLAFSSSTRSYQAELAGITPVPLLTPVQVTVTDWPSVIDAGGAMACICRSGTIAVVTCSVCVLVVVLLSSCSSSLM